MSEQLVRSSPQATGAHGAATAPGPQPGLLAQARLAAGLDITALALALKVSVKKLQALEAGRYEELPDRVFARVLAQSVCRHLQIDPAPILEQIPSVPSAELGDPQTALNVPFRGQSPGMPRHLADWLVHPAVLISAALTLAALVLWWWPSGLLVSDAQSDRPPTASAEATKVSTFDAIWPFSSGTTEGAEPSSGASVQPAAPHGRAALPGATAAVSSPGQSLAVATTGALPSPSGAAALSIRATTAPSWIEVRGAKGEVVRRLLNPAEVLDFSSDLPYAVVLGNAAHTQVWVRGQAFDVTPFVRNAVARFEVR